MEECLIREKRKQNWLIATISASIFMFSLDYSMLNISLPAITNYFNTTIAKVSMLPLAYLLVVTSTVLLFGKLADIIGFKKIFLAGLLIFIAGSSMCGLAPTLNILLPLRVFQCLGEAMFSPIGIAIITTFLPSSIQGKALGIMATAQGLGFALGPIIGGFINDHMNWHMIFFVNVPIGILVAVAAARILPAQREGSADRRIDILGAVLIFISLTALIYDINSVSKMGIGSPIIISCFIISLIAMALFVIREKTAANPILDLSLLKNLNFTFAIISAFCAIFIYMGLLFLFPFYLNLVKGLDAQRSGMILMIPALMLMVCAPIAGKVSDMIGSRKLCSIGIALTGVSFFIFSFLEPKTPILFVILPLVIAGISIGSFLPANNKLVMIHAPADKQGMASAVYKIVMSMGGIFGIAVLPIVLMKAIHDKIAVIHMSIQDVKHSPEVMMVGFDAAFKFSVIICLVGLIFAFLARDKKASSI
ncbi:MAG: MFS transporter [Candidatus Omnitrophota bacterium]|nr:MFS transporter [Candidatus Omnitrophota bacterium]